MRAADKMKSKQKNVLKFGFQFKLIVFLILIVMQPRIVGCLTEAEKQCQQCGHFSQC